MITESHGRSHTGSTNDSYTRRPPLTSKSLPCAAPVAVEGIECGATLWVGVNGVPARLRSRQMFRRYWLIVLGRTSNGVAME